MTVVLPRAVDNASLPIARRLFQIPAAIKFQETLFALPFAFSGMFLAAEGFPSLVQFVWITVAMIGGRTLGMAANRLFDRKIDAANPRTVDRELPTGRLLVADMTVLSIVGLTVLLIAAWKLNSLALLLAPIAAAYLLLYPFTKRFTFLANPLLGWALAIAPSAAWIGVRGSLSWEPVLLSFGVAMWAGSFDIVYHAQDFKFQREKGLHSVAAKFGIDTAFLIARVMDVTAAASLLALGLAMDLAWPFYVGWSLAMGGLGYKYFRVSPGNLSCLGPAFFRVNAYVSVAILAGIATAVFL